MRRLLPFALLGLATPPALSQTPLVQSNAALMANDSYTRSHDYDLIHQRIAVSRFNWDSTSFDGKVTTTLVARRAGLTEVVLDEGRLLANTSVTDRSGQALATSRHGDTLVVSTLKPMRFGDTLVFTVTYRGKVASGRGLTFIRTDGLEHRPDQIWSQGEDHDNHFWFPTYDFPNDKMTWELVATVPKEHLAISNGRLMSNLVTGGNRTMTWSQTTPSATYLVSLIVAPLATIHDTWHGVPVDYYTYHEDSTRAWRLFHVTPDMIGTYSRLTGIKYPWAKYAQTTVADFFGGMENVSATTLVDWLPDATAYLDRPWYQYILIPHELAHQWFGDYVTTVNWANMWLNEGFAEFMPGQYWREKLGSHAAEDYYLDEYQQYLQIESGRSMPLASLGSNNIYPKGALVIQMLQDYLGPERFWASVHTFLSQHAFGVATSDDFRQAVLTATGENLDWFWNEWMYEAGFPKFVVTAKYDAPGARLTLIVKQTQVDSFKVDSTGRLFSIPQVFRMPVTVRVGFAGRQRTQGFELMARQQTLVIDSVAAEPSMVVFDDGNHILKSLEFDQPVAWLVAQLQQDRNLWNRHWVIDQLARHPNDPMAAAAVATAATTADYYLTRAEAIEALPAFPPETARPALIAATKDTAALVRAAALEALGKVGGTDAAAVAHTAFTNDSSYTVRASALTALSRLDSAQARTLLPRALRTPSYQDVILGAGLMATLQLNDTTVMTQVDDQIGRLEFAAHVLATFGGRGNAHALDLLTARLDDPRAAVRRWTVRQFQQTMARLNKSLALSRLERAVPTLKYPETQTAVTGVIAALRKP